MNAEEEKVRELIACQAGEWVAAHQAGELDAAERRAFHAWLMTSPVHVEEYLGVSLLARRMPTAAADPQQSLETILERVRQESDGISTIGDATFRSRAAPRNSLPRRPLWAAPAAAVIAVVVAFWWLLAEHATTDRYATRHGEMKSWHLSDDTVLRLNTDSSVVTRYTRSQRLIKVERGEVLFEVAHDQARPFRVDAGTASVVDVGTTFNVYRQPGSTLVTVVQGRVGVSTTAANDTPINAGAGEQVRVTDGQPPQPAAPADVQRSTAWLHRQIIFEREPLAQVTAEFNRYSAQPIDIETSTLGTLPITGIFAVDDTETFLDFLRTFDKITIRATPTRILVFQETLTPPDPPPAERPRL